MGLVIGIIVVVFLFGLLFRSKGDGVLDTLGSGCNAIAGIIAIIGLLIWAQQMGYIK
jgi:hypothetical protein